MKKNTKGVGNVIKAWAVYVRKSYKHTFELAEADAQGDCDCCSASSYAVGIYLNENTARLNSISGWNIKETKIIPVEIRILPPPKKTKKV